MCLDYLPDGQKPFIFIWRHESFNNLSDGKLLTRWDDKCFQVDGQTSHAMRSLTALLWVNNSQTKSEEAAQADELICVFRRCADVFGSGKRSKLNKEVYK